MITLNKLYLNLNSIQFIFVSLLFICLLISFYIMIVTLFSKDNTHNRIFSVWQFPMLLAVLVDTIYHTGRFKKYIC
jgi:predicted membrane channel-forming protein YqfA (hemolysin III family)